MKTKTSITLSAPLLVKIDRRIGKRGSRSAYIEKVLDDHFRDSARRAIQRRDRELIDSAAERLNKEVEDVLHFQAPYL
jgi:metal-responsive CopG/Arc/MetJ family transcriptional regulator